MLRLIFLLLFITFGNISFGQVNSMESADTVLKDRLVADRTLMAYATNRSTVSPGLCNWQMKKVSHKNARRIYTGINSSRLEMAFFVSSALPFRNAGMEANDKVQAFYEHEQQARKIHGLPPIKVLKQNKKEAMMLYASGHDLYAIHHNTGLITLLHFTGNKQQSREFKTVYSILLRQNALNEE